MSSNDNNSPKPVRLMNETFDLDDDGIMFLKSLAGKRVAVVAVAGVMYSGKSFLANQLVGHNIDAFSVGSIKNQTETCTKGLWAWNETINKDDIHIVILDVEGFVSDTDDETAMNYAKQLFALIALISSVIIYNVRKGDEDESGCITNAFIQEHIDLFNEYLKGLKQVKVNDNDAFVKSKMPKIIWVNRDYDISNDNDKVYKGAYYAAMKKKDLCNELIDEHKIKFTTLSLPMEENDMMINSYSEVENESEIEFFPKFKNELAQFRSTIIEEIIPLNIEGVMIDGDLFYGVLQEYASCMMCGDYPVIKNVIDKTIFATLNEISDGVKETLRDVIESENSFENLIKKPFDTLTQNENCLLAYNKSYIGRTLKHEYIISQVNDDIAIVSEEIRSKIKNEVDGYKSKLKSLIAALDANPVNDSDTSSSIDFHKNFVQYIDSLKSDINDILFPHSSNSFFPFFSLLNEYFSKKVIAKLEGYIGVIASSISLSQSNLEEKITQKDALIAEKTNELQLKENEILQTKIKIDDLTRKLDMCEKEYENNLEIERNKYAKKDEHYKSLLSLKDNTIKELEAKIEAINRELSRAIKDNNEKADTLRKTQQELSEYKNKSPPPTRLSEGEPKSNTSLIALLQRINRTFFDYGDIVSKLEINKSLVFHEKFIEKSVLLFDERTKAIFDEMRSVKEEHYKNMLSTYEREIANLKDENKKLLFELNKANTSLKEQANEMLCLRIKSEETTNNWKKFESLLSRQQTLINSQKETMIYYTNKIDDQNKRIENLELYFGNAMSSANYFADELDSALTLVVNIVRNEKATYLRNYTKLSETTREKIEGIRKLLKVF